MCNGCKAGAPPLSGWIDDIGGALKDAVAGGWDAGRARFQELLRSGAIDTLPPAERAELERMYLEQRVQQIAGPTRTLATIAGIGAVVWFLTR